MPLMAGISIRYQGRPEQGVKNVPTFFVNGSLVTGKPTYDTLSKAIKDALKKVKTKKPVKAAAKQRA